MIKNNHPYGIYHYSMLFDSTADLILPFWKPTIFLNTEKH